jgi:hypothetical protein
LQPIPLEKSNLIHIPFFCVSSLKIQELQLEDQDQNFETKQNYHEDDDHKAKTRLWI